MEIDLDKTQEWLNRTQAIRRTPPVRGGIVKDVRTNRETALCVLAGLLCIILVMLVPRPTPSPLERVELSAALPAVTDLAASASMIQPHYTPAQPATGALISHRPTSQLTTNPITWNAPPPNDRIAPHAPIWLESEPRPLVPEPGNPHGASSVHLPPTGLSIINR
jgi:hypothetical protein